MSLMSRIFRARDKPKVTDTSSTPGQSFRFWFGRSTSNKVVTEQSAMRVAAVYACIRVLCEGVAQLPVHFYRRTEGGGKEKATDHPLYKLLCSEPNPEMTQFTFMETMMAHLLIWGNAYAQIVRNSKKEVIGLYPLMANRMQVYRDDKHQIYYEYTLLDDEAKAVKKRILKQSDVLHIPCMGFDGLVGYSPLAVAKNAVGISLACEDYGANFFANGGTPCGVLEHPGTIKDVAKVQENWKNGFSGSNAHKVAVLEEGMKYTPISITPDEAQFLDTRKFQIDEIARIYRVPPHLIGDLDHSTFSNIEQQSLEFVTYTLQPWLIRWEQGFMRQLLTEEEKAQYFVKFSVDGLLRGDYASRMSGYATARQNGWMSSNDIRQMEDLDRIPAEEGGDLYLINGSMTKLADAGAFANKGTAQTEQAEPAAPAEPTEPNPAEPEKNKPDKVPEKGGIV